MPQFLVKVVGVVLWVGRCGDAGSCAPRFYPTVQSNCAFVPNGKSLFRRTPSTPRSKVHEADPGFAVWSRRTGAVARNSEKNMHCMQLARYGPREDRKVPKTQQDGVLEDQAEWERKDAERLKRLTLQVNALVDKLVKADEHPDQQASIMTENLEIVLSLRGYEGVKLFQDILDQAQKDDDSGDKAERVAAACEYILTFMDEFVQQARSMDEEYKALLGKIVRALSSSSSSSSSSSPAVGSDEETGLTFRMREERLDQVLDEEKDNFSPGFLRHVENECNRILSSQVMSPESAKMLETLQLVHTRIVEELGKGLGEGALVLGQLVGYDDKAERIAVLEAGLTVRGLDFAKELSSMTQEALEGFANVPGGVDPDLLHRVDEIHESVNEFIVHNGGGGGGMGSNSELGP